jgi:flagellar basal body-associated protein FliL
VALRNTACAGPGRQEADQTEVREAPAVSKIKIIAPVLLLVALGAAYKFVLAKPSEPAPKPKIEGTVYILPKEFLLNLADDRFAKLNVALVLHHGFLAEATASAGGHGAPSPPEGFGPLPQEAVVRDVVTDRITNATGPDLIERKGRAELKHDIKESIEKHTDVKVDEVLFTDVAVQ